MGNCLSCFRREDQPTNYIQLQQSLDDSSDCEQTSDHNTVEIDKSKSHYTQELERQLGSVNEELKMVEEEKKEQCQMLSAKIEELKMCLESQRNELEMERFSKERELQKITTKREKEVADYKKQLTFITQELQAEKQKLLLLQEEQSAEGSNYSPGTQYLEHSPSQEHSWRTTAEPTLGSDNLVELVNELDDVTAQWFSLGVQLKVPYKNLQVLSCNHKGDVRRCMVEMIQCWLNNTSDAKWSTIVQVLAKIGSKSLAHKIALDHGIATAGIDDVDSASAAVRENVMEHPTLTQKTLMESVDELERNIRNTELKLNKQKQVHKEAEQDAYVIRQRFSDVKERMSHHHSRVEELIEEKMKLEKALKLRETEVEILREYARKEITQLIALREEEVAKYQNKLDSVKQELEEEKQKIPPLKEEIQQLLVDLAEKSKQICHLTQAMEESNSQLKMERERVEMRTKELRAAAVSHAEHMKEVETQLTSLEESEKQNKVVICSLQAIIHDKKVEIQALSQQIHLKECQEKKQISIELADMKMNMIQLQSEIDQLRTSLKLSQGEVNCYQEHATSLLTDIHRPIKVALKWSDRKRAPEAMYRGAAVVHGSIAYVIGLGSWTIYSYKMDGDQWSKHSKCPHVNPGLVIINDLLTAVGGKKGDHPTNKLVSWNCSKWVETFPPMQTPRESPALVHYGKYVIAMGGDCEGRGVELLHIPSLDWSTATSLPRSLLRITATLCHNGIIAMDEWGYACRINMDYLLPGIQLKESSTEHSQWISLPKCPVGPTVTTTHGQCLVVSYYGIFQLQEGQWVRIGDMSLPMLYCIVCVRCDQMVVVGGYDYGFTPTDAVRVAVIV